jgi:serine/threonine protein kinase
MQIVIYETECAAKIIHEGLITEGIINPSQFKKELRLQATLRHPNITQFIGICKLEESSLDVLVMELMHSNLHEFLSKPDMQNNIPLSRKKSILEDVARGLLYLHRKDIVHRDLTAKNVLLTSALVAKIADLGTSRMVPKQVDLQRSLMTTYPGTTVYMPPEADRADYDAKKLDIFSFGHLTLFTLIQVAIDKFLTCA